ncbi:hypothetical protein CA13_65160 [Planctomycetes bacterium CA13]|uniref:protein-tyrosine-phosphatase n=1 Tax=Novipirellula herctigrandis TaxID=2527986 RepID=A0A5C5ZCI3_9BACT|nr:hypothetical protein CA13_65160 [Planctomycetes bacterium CA13]
MKAFCEQLSGLLTTFGVLLVFVGFIALISLGENASAQSRHCPLEGQSNFRDLGGYETKDGRSVKWKQIFRSGELPKLTDKDVQRLADLKLKTVVNFLTAKEIEFHGEDRLPSGVQPVSNPIESDFGDLAITIVEARKHADFSKVPPELNAEIHRLLVSEETSRRQYADFLRRAADPENRPLVFHCSHGVHRTGTAAAILLATLGVPWDTIRDDYLLSNVYREEEVKLRLEQFRKQAAENRGIAPDEVDMTNFKAFYELRGSYLDAARDEVMENYESVEDFVINGLGLTQADIDRLRETLLE